MSLIYADGMVNSADPDQTARKGVCFDLSVSILGAFTVVPI